MADEIKDRAQYDRHPAAIADFFLVKFAATGRPLAVASIEGAAAAAGELAGRIGCSPRWQRLPRPLSLSDFGIYF